jgi:hypothetical protein
MSPKDFQITCSQVRASMSDYLEGVPLGASREIMRDHLESCVACRTGLREEKQLLDDLDRLQKMSAPTGFTERALAVILPQAHSHEALLPRLIRGLAVAAALFLLVMILVRTFDPGSPELPAPLVDSAAQTLLERGDEIGEGFRTLGRATGSFSDTLEPVKVLGRAGGLVFGNMPPTFIGLLLLGALLPVLLIVTIVLRYRMKGAVTHVH